MSIASEVERISTNVQNTLEAIRQTGVSVPENATSDDLLAAAAALTNEKQDKLTGSQGQVVGFDAEGNAVAQEPPQGPAGAAAGFGEVTATVDDGVGTPSVTVTPGGPDTAKTFAFAFHNLKGEKGDTGEQGPDGQDGEQGPAGAAATINGVNALTITTNNGLVGSQSEGTYTISGENLVPKTEKGKANGVATLGADGKLTDAQVPAAAKVAYTSNEQTTVSGALDALFQGLADGTITSVTATATAAGWSGDIPVQTINVAGMTATSIAWVGLPETATAQQRDAARKAVMSPTAQGAGTITLTCDGAKPAVDIPIIVYLSGGAN